MDLTIILQQMGVICILVAIGFFLEKKDVIDSLTSRKLSAIVVDVCNPAMILASILSGNITASHADLINAIILGLIFYVTLVIIGFIMPHILRVAPDKRKFYNLMCVYTNTGFLGIPVAKAILPANSIIYVIVINVFYSLFFYTHGLTILGNGPESEGKKDENPLKHILNPGTIMAILALVVFWFSLELPPILANTVEYVGNATVFLSMVMLGVSIARSNLLKSIANARIWIFIVLRLVILPVIVVLVMHALSFDKTATLGVALMAAVPVGNLPMIEAEKKGMDSTILSSAIAITTTVSIITITALIAVATALL
ncbi:MAG: AEC family transporter [Lachnospiraceae bacterium]|nr:AEC family transporter [Lachnospiraceae bacterium]